MRLSGGGLEEGSVGGAEGGGRGERGIGHTQQDVLRQGAVEKMCVLGDDGNARAVDGGRDGGQRDAIGRQSAAGWGMQIGKQEEER